MSVFELIGEAAMSIEDPGELSIAERHALSHLLEALKKKNEAVLASDRRLERRHEAEDRRKAAGHVRG